MHLADYMAEKGLTDEDVAQAIGRSRVSVSRYRRKLERPNWDVVDRFYEWSGGVISANDWPAPIESQSEAAE